MAHVLGSHRASEARASKAPIFPRAVPYGKVAPEVLTEIIREMRTYLEGIPAVDAVTFEGTIELPMIVTTVLRRPHYIAFTARPFPDDGSTVYEVLGLTWSWTARNGGGADVKIETIDGVAVGNEVTLSGIVVGER